MKCSKCGRNFTEYRNSDAKLIQAIFGETLCEDCFEGKDPQPCFYCGETTLAPVYYNNLPYHPKCLAKELKL